ncbi:ABC transporter substrate-binding protein [Microbacterium saperdae]|uniref:Peptide/nickel transport system substrate-binding protein n=1 Tax=Microbacterium saperdae TaxID=69368 RepID=A0A543BP43_9MICO|nr:ABC transporter substrate-binding protein [Microbacterium saperdae]TQL86605.1 peptide/nickel transport system substrate-binding protein [Microbacterium saperdae]GGM46683.1 peptide ABC transporter substrate-binding protein [Microbacterium saperdae]
MHDNRWRKTLPLVAGAAALALALGGCTPTGSASGGDRPLRMWSGSMTPITNNFNPFAVDTATHMTFGAIYEPLFFFNQLSDEAPVGLIGDSFEFNEDGTVLTVKIKPDLKWSDGEDLTAADVAFSLGYGSNLDPDMVSAEAPDDTTVVITYSSAKFTATSLILGSTWIIPEHIWSEIDDYMTETNPKPVGSGPYTLKSFTDAAYTLEANPLFRDGPPKIKEVQDIGIDSNQSSEDLLKTGKLDWVGQFIANPDGVTANGRISTMNQQQDPTVIMTCADTAMGCTGAQTDPAVRQALNIAIDRAAISKKAFAGLSGESSPSFALLPRDEKWLGDPALATSPQAPDAASAEGILEAAGYSKGSDGFYGKDGVAIELDLFSPDGWTDYNDAAKLISAQAAEAGIRVNARTVSEAEYWTPISTGEFQLALYGLTQSLVADPYSNYDQYFTTTASAQVGEEPTKGQNYSRYSNPVVDEAVKKAGATQDEAIKQQAYAAIQTEIARDLPYIPVVLNASQSFFNTADFTGWPSESDMYAAPLPYLSTASAVILTHLSPVTK